MASSFDAFDTDRGDSVVRSASARPFDDDGYLGCDHRLPSQQYDPSYSAFSPASGKDGEIIKEEHGGSPGFDEVRIHHIALGDGGSFPQSPDAFRCISESLPEFPPQSTFGVPESNGSVDHGGIFSDSPILPPPGGMEREEGFILRQWRRENALLLQRKEEQEKEERERIYIEAEEFKSALYEKRKLNAETSKIQNREREKLFLSNQEKFHANADKHYWKAIAELIPNEVPNIEKKRGKKDQEKKPSIVVIQGPKPGKPTELSRMRQILLKLKHNPPPHMIPPPPAPVNATKGGAANAKDGTATGTAAAGTAAVSTVAPATALGGKKQSSTTLHRTTANHNTSSKEETHVTPASEVAPTD